MAEHVHHQAVPGPVPGPRPRPLFRCAVFGGTAVALVMAVPLVGMPLLAAAPALPLLLLSGMAALEHRQTQPRPPVAAPEALPDVPLLTYQPATPLPPMEKHHG